MSTNVIPPKELLEATTGGLSVLVVAGGAGGDVLTRQSDGTYAPMAPSASSGDVVGPASATDNAIVRFDSTTGKLVQSSGVSVSDAFGSPLTSYSVFIPGTSGYLDLRGYQGVLIRTYSNTGGLYVDCDGNNVRLVAYKIPDHGATGLGYLTAELDSSTTRLKASGTTVVTVSQTTTNMLVQATGSTLIPLTVKAAASQTANLTEWQNSSGSVGARITAAREFSYDYLSAGNEVFGAGASGSAAGLQVAIGKSCIVDGQQSIGIGYVANPAAYHAIGIGSFCYIAGSQAIGIGWATRAGGADQISIGDGTGGTGARTVTLGNAGVANFADCVLLGYSVTATAANQFIAGSTTTAINNVYFGKGVVHATPTAYTINGTGGLGTNIAGANLNLAGGKGTGTGTGGSVVIQVAPAGSSGSTANTLVDVLTIDSTKLITLADATNIALNTTTGTKIGTATSQKLGLWNATPIVQPTTGVGAATLVSNGGTALTDTDTFDGYTLKQIVKALREIGALA